MSNVEIVIGNTSDYIRIQGVKEKDPKSLSLGWLDAEVSLSIGGFSGRYSACFDVSDFVNFFQEIKVLYQTLKGEAVFAAFQRELQLKLIGDGRGHITIVGTAIEGEGFPGIKLEFEFEIDQTYLPETISQIDKLINLPGK